MHAPILDRFLLVRLQFDVMIAFDANFDGFKNHKYYYKLSNNLFSGFTAIDIVYIKLTFDRF